MNALKEWLSDDKNQMDVPLDDLHLIVNDLDKQAVSMKASSTFPLTYTLVVNVRFSIYNFFNRKYEQEK